MLDSHGLVLTLLWLAAAAGIFLFTRWLNRFLDRFELDADMRVLAMISFVGMMLVGTLSFLWKLEDKQAPPQPPPNNNPQHPQPETKLESFEATAYPDLFGLRQQMIKQLTGLETFFRQVEDWAREMPTQRPFLQKIVNIRWEQREKLREAYGKINLSREEFWLHYNTGSDRHVREMFDSEALRLQKRIQDALGTSREFQQTEKDSINDHLASAGDLLEGNIKNKTKAKSKSKTRQTLPALPQFEPYTEENRQTLIQWLTQRQETSVLAQLQQLQQEETKIREKMNYILEYQKINTDLVEPVKDLFDTWNRALSYNLYAQYRLLFAAETLELALRLGISADDRNLARLHTQLLQLSPKVLEDALEERRNAEYSYQPEKDHLYRK
jgi:hypothetical protein